MDFIPPLEFLKDEKLLGEGGFGRTYRGRYLPRNLEVCIKVVPTEKFQLLRHACSDKVTQLSLKIFLHVLFNQFSFICFGDLQL